MTVMTVVAFFPIAPFKLPHPPGRRSRSQGGVDAQRLWLHDSAVASREPTALSALLPSMLARLARESGRVERLAPVWDEIAGPQLSRQARPHALEGGTLVLSVRQAHWAHALSAQQAVLCGRLNARLGGTPIERLEFRLEPTA